MHTIARLGLVLVFLLASFEAHAAGVTGTQETIRPVATVTWGQMLKLDAQRKKTAAPAKPAVVPFMPAPPAKDLGAVGTAAAPSAKAGVNPPPAPQPQAAVSANFMALPDNGTVIPPDTMGAVGPNHVLTMLNSQVRIQDKFGANISTVSLATFWTAGGLNGAPFDPHVIYDPFSNRWIATCDANSRSAQSQVWFAISQTNDPRILNAVFRNNGLFFVYREGCPTNRKMQTVRHPSGMK